jgi:hypothetical protein
VVLGVIMVGTGGGGLELSAGGEDPPVGAATMLRLGGTRTVAFVVAVATLWQLRLFSRWPDC